MLMIRLARIGKKKRPFYRVVVTEKTRPRNGRFVEIVGTYDPLKKPAAVEMSIASACSTGSARARNPATRFAACCATLSLPKASHFYRVSCAWLSYTLKRISPLGTAHCGGSAMKELVEADSESTRRSSGSSTGECSGRRAGTVLELRVHPEDLGKVIGRQGRTAKSIRTLLGAAGMKLKKRFTLEILE